MADAWSTVIEREPEWDEYTQSRVLAYIAYQSRCCPSCGNYQSMVPAGEDKRTVAGPDGQVFKVQMQRCVACGLEELVRREWHAAHKDEVPNQTGALSGDGLSFVPRPEEE